MWRRFVCTANRYLGCMIKMELNPPWLRKPQVMIEVHQLYPHCVKYSDAAVGNVPTIPEVDGKRADDLYVNQEDLPLLECWIDRKVGIDEIKKIYLDEEAEEKVKRRVKEFSKKHGIPVENRLPCPSDDDRIMREWDRPRDWGVTDEGLKELVNFLKNRSKSCWRYAGKLPSDSVAAALAESLDEVFHREWPLGASDAVSKRNERLRERPPWSLPPPEPECDTVICKTEKISLEGMRGELGGEMSSLDEMRRELRERYGRLKTGNLPRIETVKMAERATVYDVDGRYTVHLYGSWAGPKIYTSLKSVSFPALTRWERIDERASRAVFPHPTNIKVDIDKGIMG